MKSIYTLAIGILLVSAQSACRNDIDIPQEMETQTPTLNCLAHTGTDTEFAVYLSRTSLWTPTTLPGASLSLWINGEERAQGKQDPRNSSSDGMPYTAYLMKATIAPGDEVEIKAMTPQGEMLSSHQRAPQKPQLISATLGEYVSNRHNGYYPLKVTVKDHAQEGNYYRIILKGHVVCFAPEDRNQQSPIRVPVDYINADYRKDFILCDGSPKGIMDDEDDVLGILDNTFSNRYLTFGDHLFAGQEVTINLELKDIGRYTDAIDSAIDYRRYPNGVIASHVEISVYLEGITQDAHRYYRSLSAVSDDNYDPENPFATPIKLHTNIHNGAGIFAIGTRAEPIVLQGYKL